MKVFYVQFEVPGGKKTTVASGELDGRRKQSVPRLFARHVHTMRKGFNIMCGVLCAPFNHTCWRAKLESQLKGLNAQACAHVLEYNNIFMRTPCG